MTIHEAQVGGTPWRTHVINLVILCVVIVLPRILVIAYTVAPARDALRYIHAAQQFESKPFLEATAAVPAHPGYPVTLYWIHELWVLLTADMGPYGWMWAAQIWSVVCFTVFLSLAYLAGSMLWNANIAVLGCLAVSLLPRPMTYSVDVLTDNLHAAIWMGTFALLVWHWQRPAWWKPFLAGIGAGLAYWTRLEAFILPCVVVGGVALSSIRWRWSLAGMTLISFALPFVILAGSYMKTIGGISVRKVADDVLAAKVAASPVMAEPQTKPVGAPADVTLTPSELEQVRAAPVEAVVPISSQTSVLELDKLDTTLPFANRELRGYEKGTLVDSMRCLLRELGEETRIWILVFAIVGVFLPGKHKLRFPEGFLPLFAILGIMALLVLMKMRAGYLAGRYALPVLPLLAMLGVSGAWRVLELLTALPLLPWERPWSASLAARRRKWVGGGALVVLVLVLCLPRWFRPLHSSHRPHMEAAQWLREHSGPSDRIYDQAEISSFFASRETWRPTTAVPRDLPIRYALLDADLFDRTEEPELTAIARIHEEGKLVRVFERGSGSHKHSLYLFELTSSPLAISEEQLTK